MLRKKLPMGVPCVVDPLNFCNQEETGINYATPVSYMKNNKKLCICIVNSLNEKGEYEQIYKVISAGLLYPVTILDNGALDKAMIIRYPESMPKFEKEDLDCINSIIISSKLNHPIESSMTNRLSMIYSKLQWYAKTWSSIIDKGANNTDV